MSDRCNKLVILAAGISSRLRQSISQHPLDAEITRQSETHTKGMLSVGYEGTPLLDYQLWNAQRAGITDTIIVMNERDEHIHARYGMYDRDNDFHGLAISYAIQSIPAGRMKPFGTADALYRALLARTDWRNDYFLVCNSDNLYSVNSIAALCDLDQGGLIGYDIDGLEFDEHRLGNFGIVEWDENFFLKTIMEKPGSDFIRERKASGESVHVSMNIWRLQYDVVLPYLEHCPLHSVRLEKELPRAIASMIADCPRSMKVIPLREHVPDLTFKDDIHEMKRYLARMFGTLKWN